MSDPNGPDAAWLVDLAAGEDYLRRGQRQEALQAYQRSKQAAGLLARQSLLYNLLKARLYDLEQAPGARGQGLETGP